MSPFRCAREKEIAALLERGQWPRASPRDLLIHAEGCGACKDMIAVTRALRAERAHAAATPVLPSAGALWWRAQLRKRNEVIEKIARPLYGAQIFALMVALLAAVGGAVWQFRRGQQLLAWIEQLQRTLHLSALLPASMPNFDGSLWFLLPLLAMLALAGGVAVYVSLEKQ